MNTRSVDQCLVVALALGCVAPLAADPVHGVWREPETGIDVEIRACDADPALLGLEILSGFQQIDADRWQGGGEHGRLPGRIYLPANGDTLGDHRNRYEVHVQGDRLVIRIANCALLGCLGKSVWQRAPAL